MRTASASSSSSSAQRSSSHERKDKVANKDAPKQRLSSESSRPPQQPTQHRLERFRDSFEASRSSRPVALSVPAAAPTRLSARAAPAASAPAASVDPRIASRVSVTPHSQGPNGSFDVKSVAYQDDTQSAGRHNVYVRILDPKGQELPPADMQKWFDVQTVAGPGQPPVSAGAKVNDPYGVQKDAWSTSANTGGPTAGYFDAPLYGGNAMQVFIKPKDVPGNPYAGYGSQQVGPLTMPGNHHVNYLVTFQANPASAPQPQAPAQPPQGPTTPQNPTAPQGPVQPPTTPPATAPVLQRGAQGPEVLAMQQELVRTGYMTQEQLATGPGIFGPFTEGALKSFQGRSNLPATGVYDEATRQALAAAPSASTPVTGPTGPAPVGAPGSVYAPYEVTPGVQVNGRLGAHWPVEYDPRNTAQVDSIISKMKDMGVGYTTMNISPQDLNNPHLQPHIQQVFDKLKANGITPTVRIYEPSSPDQWNQETIDRMSNAAVTLGNMGVQLIQLGNEPNIETHLEGRQGQVTKEQYLRNSIDRQVDALVSMQDALDRADLGDKVQVGLPPMAAGSSDGAAFAFAPDTYYKELVKSVAEREKTLSPPRRLVDWIATHTYVWEDGVNTGNTPGSGGARGQMGWGPETNLWYERWAQEALGYAPRSLSTEGGPSPDSFRANNTSQVAKEMGTNLTQLQNDSRLTGCLWLEWESERGSNRWDRSVFLHGDGAWSEGLPTYRDAWQQAHS